MKRILLAGALCLSLGGCAELQAALNAVSPGTASAASPAVTTVTLDATKGAFAAEAAVDVATVAATQAANSGLLKGQNAQTALNLVTQAHGFIDKMHAAITLGDNAAVALNAQQALNTSAQVHSMTPGS